MRPVLVSERSIAWGDIGSLATLDAMRRIVNSAIKTPFVVEHAHAIARTVGPRQYRAMAYAIRDFLTRFFFFIPDPVGVELLRTPDFLLHQYDTEMRITGDCDDAAVLGAALGKAMGIPAQFVAIGFKAGGPLAHVYTNLLVGGSAVDLDITKPSGNTPLTKRRVTREV